VPGRHDDVSHNVGGILGPGCARVEVVLDMTEAWNPLA
jgi:hypothetical protein